MESQHVTCLDSPSLHCVPSHLALGETREGNGNGNYVTSIYRNLFVHIIPPYNPVHFYSCYVTFILLFQSLYKWEKTQINLLISSALLVQFSQFITLIYIRDLSSACSLSTIYNSPLLWRPKVTLAKDNLIFEFKYKSSRMILSAKWSTKWFAVPLNV